MAVILTLNTGSSSLKFAVFDAESASNGKPDRLIEGSAERRDGRLRAKVKGSGEARDVTVPLPDYGFAQAAMRVVTMSLEARLPDASVVAVGHRVVHGGARFQGPVVVDEAAAQAMRELAPLAPLHQPYSLVDIEAATIAFPRALQVASFDTAFHRTMPWENEAFAIPRPLHRKGVRRYGFHGLSYAYIAQRLTVLGALAPRTVVAHLGNGSSLCALRDGASVATTMGMTPLAGLPMGTRPGRLDPGVVVHLARSGGPDGSPMTLDALEHLLAHECGLKALGGSNDVRDLEAAGTPEAAEALGYFCARCSEEVTRMACALGGIDQLVFTGGIGENSAGIRAGVVERLGWIGAALDPAANGAPEEGVNLAADGSKFAIRVVPTDEEATIFAEALRLWKEQRRAA